MTEPILLEVVTPERRVFAQQVSELQFPTLDLGYYGILPGHTPLMTAVGDGLIHYTQNGQKHWLTVFGGFAEVGPDHVTILARASETVDMIDLDAASERGIPVCNVPDYCIEEVSTHAIAFVLALNRRLFPQTAHVAAGKWGGAPGGMPARLSLQNMGVLGLGRIGREVARKAQGVGLKVLAYDPYLAADQAQALVVEPVGLEDLLRQKKPPGTEPHFSLKIVFQGENVEGQGGPYRQFFTDVSNELKVRHDV
jgi:ATP synthase F1 epsilon subunit